MRKIAERRVAQAKSRAEAKRNRPLFVAPLPPEDAERLAKAGPGAIVWLSNEAAAVIQRPDRRRQ